MAAKMSMKQVLGGSRLLQQTAARRAGGAGRRPFTVAAAAPENERRERLPGEHGLYGCCLFRPGCSPAFLCIIMPLTLAPAPLLL
jgi:hypothetical protein